MDTTRLLLTEGQYGGYIYNDAGMRRLFAHEMNEVAMKHGFATSHELVAAIVERLGSERGEIKLEGKGRKMVATLVRA